MSAVTASPAARRRSSLTLRLALRELSGGLSGFYVFIACIALGVAAIAGVGSFSRGLADGLAREGRTIAGGDIAFSLIHREVTDAERAFLNEKGRLSVAATMRAMARAPDGRTALIELKAVDGTYPLFGKVALDPEGDLASALARRDGVFGAAVDPALLARLDLEPGARVTVGEATIELRTTLKTEPDKLAGGIAFGPRLLISEEALRATGLIQPGSLIRWSYRLRLPEADAADRLAKAVVTESETRLPEAGWEVRTRSNASPQLGRNIERFTQFLTLVGLTALLVGGVGVANAVKHYLDRKRDVIATLKSLGATGGRIFAIYFTEVMLLALVGTAIGLAVGAALPFGIAAALGAVLPIPIEPALHAGELMLAVAYGLLTAAAFALWPIGRAHDVPVSALFRDEVAPERRIPRKRYVALTVLAVGLLAVLAVLLAYDRRIAMIFVGAAAAVFVALRLMALAIMALARRAPRPRSALLRLVIANIHRPGALTPTVVLSLGLGLSLLVTLTQIEGNLREQFVEALPDNAPSFFFVDIQDADTSRFDAFVNARASGVYQRVPMLRGRIVGARGLRAEDLKPSPSAAWVLQSDRGISYTDEVPAGSRVVGGTWWGAGYRGAPQVSIENRIAEGLGLKIGDELVVNVLGRNIRATIGNLRVVDWQSLGINFVLVFSPNTFRGAPHTHIATLAFPNGGATPAEETALLKAVAAAFPTVTAVRVRDALDSIAKVVLDLTLAIRGASAVTLICAVLVLAGALATGHRHRVYDAVVLKMLGATRLRLVAAYGLEYLALGLATGVIGVAAGSVSAWMVMTEVMNLKFIWLPGPAALAALAALALTILFGLIGTFTALGQKPARVLRHL